ncbi:glycosyltransferase family 8 protein [Chelatococcus sp. GCM10030263]|uniref:glycosyltransferase family 8 protein n=1 Tax=Chelatococcus sp. GCM10030263 TaxID=3273387 RepID=UPI00361F0E84
MIDVAMSPGANRAAVCLTPDARYFRVAVFVAQALLAQEPEGQFDILILCEGKDVAAGYGDLPAGLRAQITLLPWAEAGATCGLPLGRHITPAAYRRLFLPAVLPERYERILYLDSDVAVVRPGMADVLQVPLGDKPLAAAIDMIFLKDFENGPLTAEFRAYRAGLGLPVDTPYFNSGVLLIDRANWQRRDVTGKALAYLRENADRCLFHDQSALNAVLRDDWLALSPRYNFMGDFLRLDVETALAPVVLHFVNHPKPWHFDAWQGERRFAEIYRAFLAATPWATEAKPALEATGGLALPLTPEFARFRKRLLAFLASQTFIDCPGGRLRLPSAAEPAGKAQLSLRPARA